MCINYLCRKVNGLINGGICTNEAPILEDIKVLTAVKDDSKAKLKVRTIVERAFYVCFNLYGRVLIKSARDKSSSCIIIIIKRDVLCII